MGRNLQFCLATLIVLTSFPQANSQAGFFKSETCFHQDAPCSIQNVTCSDDERIVILNEQHAFSNGTATCTDRCALECCQEGNFQCFYRVSGQTFSRTFSNCWNKTSCQYIPLPESRVFTNALQCSNGSSLFGVLDYNCIEESSVRDFTDPTPAVGNLLMSYFSTSSRVYPACVRPNSTLQCRVEREQGGDVYVRVMLVMNHSTPGNCSNLHFATGNYKSPEVACSSYTEYTAMDTYIQAQFFLVLQLNNVKDEAWAVVQSPNGLKMTCGQTCSSTTAVPTSSSLSTLPSSSANTPQSTHTTTEPSSTTPQISSMRPPSSSDSVSQSVSTPTTDLGRTSMETGGGEAITTPIIATLAVLSVLLATALCVAIWVILRQRRTQADDTYARTLPVPAEERPYASLHADPGPRPQVVSLEPLSDAQPGQAPARGDYPREPQYEDVV